MARFIFVRPLAALGFRQVSDGDISAGYRIEAVINTPVMA